MPTIEELAEKYKTGKVISPDQINIDDLANKYRVSAKAIVTPTPTAGNVSAAAGLKRGALDVSDTLDMALQPSVGRLLGLPSTEEARTARRQQYEKDFSGNTAADIGRTGGQVLATAPFVPAGGIAASFRNAPAVAALGSGMVNRLGATMATGGAAGGVYGAMTHAASKDDLASDIAFNAGAGAIGAPIVSGAGKLGSMIIPGIRSLNANMEIINAAKNAGAPPSAIKNIVQRLEDAGLTPDRAKSELNRLGSKATIADLDPSLQTEASGLAALSGKPTAILKGRFGARADQANNAAVQLVESRLGSKPDLEAEKQSIVDRALILTGPDYKAAKASGTQLDTLNIVDHIDGELEKAVGREAGELDKAKSYLYTNNGVLKNDVASLHKVRQALDDTLSRLPKEGTSQGTATYRAVSTIRDLVDAKLKTIPEMAAADTKFSEHMKIKEGLQIGYDALTKKTNKEDFIKVFNAAPTEMQNTIQKGLLKAVYDVMESSAQGEGSASQRLFNKKAVNKEILKAAFGNRGSSVIDAIHDEVAQRGTERAVNVGSQTAERQAVRHRYEGQDKPHLGDYSLGAALDAYGAGGAATAAMVVKRGITNRLIARSESKLGQLTEGSADLLSRQGAERDIGISVLDQVSKIQNRLKVASPLERLPLPKLPTLSAGVGSKTYNEVYNKSQ